MKNLFFVLLGILLIGQVKADEVLVQNNFSIQNINKEFSIQHLNSRDLYIIHFGITWANFNSSIHSNGFNLSQTKGVNFINPKLPEDCTLVNSTTTNLPISGFLNGIETGSNILQFVLKGKSCGVYTQALRETNFEAIFHNVPAMQTNAPATQNLHLEMLEIP